MGAMWWNVRACRRGLVAGAIVAGAIGVTIAPVSAADTSPPNVTVAVPTANQSFPSGTVVLSGQATDDMGVASAGVTIRNRSTGQYRQANGTWGTTAATLGAALGTAGATTTAWSYAWGGAVAGSYAVTPAATDAAGNA